MKSVGTRLGAILAFVIASIGLALLTVVLLSPLIYRWTMDWFSLPAISGLSSAALLDNYRAIIRFLLDPFTRELVMPYFASSAGGQQHFLEVKYLMWAVWLLGLIACFVSAWFIGRYRNKRGNKAMKPYFNGAIVLPLILLLLIFLAFDQVFIIFHKVFFRNDLWLFDPNLDPVITVLPQGFFMILFILGILCYEAYILLFRKLLNVK